jgi:hypothetical protein
MLVEGNEPDDDGDVVALLETGGGDPEAPDEPGDDPFEEEARPGRAALMGAGDSSSAIGRPGRVISAKTRELFAKAGAAMKAQLADGSDADDLEPAIVLPGEEAEEDPVAAAKAAPAAAAPAAPAAVAVPAAASEAMEARLRLREEQLDARETELAAREARPVAPAEFRDRYLDSPAALVRELVKEWTGAEGDSAEKAEIADLITELSGQVLGFQVTPEIRTALDSRRALKTVKAHKADIARREAAMLEQQKQAQGKAQLDAAAAAIGKEFGTNAELRAKYPFLSTEDDAGPLIVDIVTRHHKKTGEQIDWEVAAERAEKLLKKNASGWYAKRRHLLTEAPAGSPAPAAAAKVIVPQGDPSGIRRSRTLSNGAAAAGSAAPESPETISDTGFSNQARRRATLAKYKATVMQPDDE